MSKFLEVELTPNQYGGGSFNCKAGFRLDNLASSFQNIDVKIDTGCSISTIPVKKLKVSDRICRSLKEADINNNVISVRSYGIETGGVFHPEPITKRQKMRREALKFQHTISDMKIDGVDIPVSNIFS